VYEQIRVDLATILTEIQAQGRFKKELLITTPQSSHVRLASGEALLNLCANNYLGLANHPAIIEAAHDALERWGYGMASVRFICGTQTVHRDLEERISAFLGTDDTILFSSCFDANGGLFEALLGESDTVISDQLNHASIIDGIRLSKARRLRYANGDMDELEARLRDAGTAGQRLIATDGVFSMDGFLARLDTICELAERHRALVMVDDSHAIGVVGDSGRGTPDRYAVSDRVDILTGTLGKAIGGASGGYVSGRREIVEVLRQRSRPYLFSNSIPPPVAAASIRALELISELPHLRARLNDNGAYFRTHMESAGFEILPGEHPIIPVMVGDELRAQDLSERLIQLGVYAVNFSFPVVPKGAARIRTQMSAAHTTDDLDFAVKCFVSAAQGSDDDA
jgi:glycine C-acetyltransferase